MRFPMLFALVLGATACRVDDFDEDGFSRAEDCDNRDPEVNPDADEICDGIDNNCDEQIDEGFDSLTLYADADGDGFGKDDESVEGCAVAEGYATVAGDCDDDDENVRPGGIEFCDLADNDCDGAVDEDIVAVTWYPDADGDTYGAATGSITSCSPQTGFSIVTGDCNDADANVHPGAAEDHCSGPDVNCDSAEPAKCESCLDLRDNGIPDAGDGLYSLDLDGTGPGAAQTMYCEMTTDGGGWTLVQRTVWAWSENQALYTGYDDWYADTVGDATPGHAYRLAGQSWQGLNIDQDHLMINALRTTDGGSCDPLYYKATAGVLDVTETTTTITGADQPVRMFNGTELSTNDSGPDACGSSHNGVPWFYGACCAMCPTYQGLYWSDEAHPMTNRAGVADLFGNYRIPACGTKAALKAETGTTYYGVDSMEYYIR